MSNARPSNLPTRPQTAKIQRDRAQRDKNRYTELNTFTLKFSKGKLEFEKKKTVY